MLAFAGALVCLLLSSCFAARHPAQPPTGASGDPQLSPPVSAPARTIAADLDQLFDRDPALARAIVAARVQSVRSGAVLYERNADKLVMPASTMKIVTVAVAADRLGWDYRYETRLESAGMVNAGVLHGDLIVTGTGDPSIGSRDAGQAPLFLEWAEALARAGIRRIDGRIIGDDNAFDDGGVGAGWAWDYLAAGYAAPAGALSYNENVAVLHIDPARTAGQPAFIQVTPPGQLLNIRNDVTTSTAGSPAVIDLERLPGSEQLTLHGHVPAGAAPIIRTASVDNPTRYFLEAMRVALLSRGILATDGVWDIDDLASAPPARARTLIARHESEPLSSLAAYAMKVSQNFYGETFFKTIGCQPGIPGSAALARDVVKTTLVNWGVPADALVMYDGSGLSRYNYVTASAMVAVLAHVWRDDRLRGPYLAALPVGGHDGTLESRMRTGPLDGHVQAKTGTINNARALVGFLETAGNDKLAFAIIVNNYTAPIATIDTVVEQALTRLAAPRPE